MSEEAPASAARVHEEFIQHMERGGRRMRTLALTTAAVAALLSLSYFSELVIVPFVLGVRTQTVDLTDPSLMALEGVLLILSLLWLYVGVSEFRFSRKLAKQVAEVRAAQAELARKYGLPLG